MKQKLHVGVITGGPSSEHEVSVNTGRMVLKFLNRKLYIPSEVRIHKNGQWQFLPQRKRYSTAAALLEVKRRFDVVFIALHGKFGEDGSLQSLLKQIGIPFTGSDAWASKLAMDKVLSDKTFKKIGLTVPRSIVLQKGRKLPRHLEFPIVVKPVHGGSSIGISIAHKEAQLTKAIRIAQNEDSQILLQQLVAGRELTCSVLEKCNKLFALTPTEIIPKISDFFDYEAKYQEGASRELTPPRLSKILIKKIKAAALTAHRAFGCRGLSRTDFILTGKVLYVLEINTIPGMTPTSLLPQEAKYDGYSFAEMLNLIITAAC